MGGRAGRYGAIVTAWVGALVAGHVALGLYASRPGEFGPGAPSSWPAAPGVIPEDGHATLLLFAHPRCPCTRSSFGELERLLTRVPERPRTWVVFRTVPGVPESVSATDIRETAASIPGVRTVEDEGGALRRLFGARTSGHAVLYSPAGDLLFEGGITGSRGHEGDNPGRVALEHLLGGDAAFEGTAPVGLTTPLDLRTPVFGCALDGAPQFPMKDAP